MFSVGMTSSSSGLRIKSFKGMLPGRIWTETALVCREFRRCRLKQQILGWSHHKAGGRIRRNRHDARRSLMTFDGRIPQFEAQFSGERFSIYGFTSRLWPAVVSETTAISFEDLGFRLPLFFGSLEYRDVPGDKTLQRGRCSRVRVASAEQLSVFLDHRLISKIERFILPLCHM